LESVVTERNVAKLLYLAITAKSAMTFVSKVRFISSSKQQWKMH